MRIVPLPSAALAVAVAFLGCAMLPAAEPAPDTPRPADQPGQPAQPEQPGQPGRPRRPGPPGDGLRAQRFFGGPPRPGGLPVERVLNEEQRASFRAELESQREHLREVNEKAATLRRELDEALFADKLDEQSVRDKSAVLAEVETERSLIRARALGKVRSTLSESQLERLRNLRTELSREGGGPGEGFRGPVDPDFRRGPGEADRPPGDRPDRGRSLRRPGGAERIERDPLPPPAPPPPPPPPPPR